MYRSSMPYSFRSRLVIAVLATVAAGIFGPVVLGSSSATPVPANRKAAAFGGGAGVNPHAIAKGRLAATISAPQLLP